MRNLLNEKVKVKISETNKYNVNTIFVGKLFKLLAPNLSMVHFHILQMMYYL